MLGYLLDAYQTKIYNLQDRKFKDWERKEKYQLYFIIISSIVGMVVLFIYNQNPYVYFLTLFGLVIINYIIIKSIVNKSINDYKDNYKNYLVKLSKLKELLRDEFNVCDKKKLEIIIELCDKELEKKDTFTKIFEPFNKVIIGAILPIITFILGRSCDKLNLHLLIIIGGLIISSILYFTGIYYIVYYFMEKSFNKERYLIKSFRSEINDIIFFNFTD